MQQRSQTNTKVQVQVCSMGLKYSATVTLSFYRPVSLGITFIMNDSASQDSHPVQTLSANAGINVPFYIAKPKVMVQQLR